MTPKQEWFISYNKISSSTMVYLGNDNTQQAIGISKVLVKMELRLTTKVGDIFHVS
jgi:hypothetical protein